MLKVAAVGADGLEGDAATLSFDLNAAVSKVTAESAANGDFLVKWTNPAAAQGSIKVTVKSVNWTTTPQPVSREMTVPQGRPQRCSRICPLTEMSIRLPFKPEIPIK